MIGQWVGGGVRGVSWEDGGRCAAWRTCSLWCFSFFLGGKRRKRRKGKNCRASESAWSGDEWARETLSRLRNNDRIQKVSLGNQTKSVSFSCFPFLLSSTALTDSCCVPFSSTLELSPPHDTIYTPCPSQTPPSLTVSPSSRSPTPMSSPTLP